MDMRNTLKFAIRVTATIGICEDQKLFGQHDFQTARGERERERADHVLFTMYLQVYLGLQGPSIAQLLTEA